MMRLIKKLTGLEKRKTEMLVRKRERGMLRNIYV